MKHRIFQYLLKSIYFSWKKLLQFRSPITIIVDCLDRGKVVGPVE